MTNLPPHLGHPGNDVRILGSVILGVSTVYPCLSALQDVNLSPLSIVFPLARELGILESPQNFLDPLCGVSQHWLEGNPWRQRAMCREVAHPMVDKGWYQNSIVWHLAALIHVQFLYVHMYHIV